MAGYGFELVNNVFTNSSAIGDNTFGGSPFPASFPSALYVMWSDMDIVTGANCHFTIQDDSPKKNGFEIAFNLANTSVNIYNANGTDIATGLTFGAVPRTNSFPVCIMVAIDTPTQTCQIFVNDTQLSQTGGVWHSTNQMGTTLNKSAANCNFLITTADLQPCLGDLFISALSSPFDLTVTANRRKFVDGNGKPVDIGATGTIPTGIQPQVLLHVAAGGSPADYTTNHGTGQNWFSNTLGDCGSWVSAAGAPFNAQLADLYFTSTPDFVDLSVVANRRLFVDATGGGVNLGPAGATPLGIQPQVFFSRGPSASADSFALNLGNGGSFTLTGGDLTNATNAPPCSQEVASAFTPASQGVGVLGDYRNGNLYALNMDTLTDNGSQRKWIRSWRALAKPSRDPVTFASLLIDMETGAQIAEGVTPKIMLRWSDDGGHTWSQPRQLSLAPLGWTAFRVKANRLGSTRITSGLDRIFELSSADAFKVALLGASIEVG